MMARVCPNCGMSTHPNDTFCGNCGVTLSPETPQAQPKNDDKQAGWAVILVVAVLVGIPLIGPDRIREWVRSMWVKVVGHAELGHQSANTPSAHS